MITSSKKYIFEVKALGHTQPLWSIIDKTKVKLNFDGLFLSMGVGVGVGVVGGGSGRLIENCLWVAKPPNKSCLAITLYWIPS